MAKRKQRLVETQSSSNNSSSNETIWSCPQCTLENPTRRRRCQVCQAHKPVDCVFALPQQPQQEAASAPQETTTTTTNHRNTSRVGRWLNKRKRQKQEKQQPPPPPQEEQESPLQQQQEIHATENATVDNDAPSFDSTYHTVRLRLFVGGTQVQRTQQDNNLKSQQKNDEQNILEAFWNLPKNREERGAARRESRSAQTIHSDPKSPSKRKRVEIQAKNTILEKPEPSNETNTGYNNNVNTAKDPSCAETENSPLTTSIETSASPLYDNRGDADEQKAATIAAENQEEGARPASETFDATCGDGDSQEENLENDLSRDIVQRTVNSSENETGASAVEETTNTDDVEVGVVVDMESNDKVALLSETTITAATVTKEELATGEEGAVVYIKSESTSITCSETGDQKLPPPDARPTESCATENNSMMEQSTNATVPNNSSLVSSPINPVAPPREPIHSAVTHQQHDIVQTENDGFSFQQQKQTMTETRSPAQPQQNEPSQSEPDLDHSTTNNTQATHVGSYPNTPSPLITQKPLESRTNIHGTQDEADEFFGASASPAKTSNFFFYTQATQQSQEYSQPSPPRHAPNTRYEAKSFISKPQQETPFASKKTNNELPGNHQSRLQETPGPVNNTAQQNKIQRPASDTISVNQQQQQNNSHSPCLPTTQTIAFHTAGNGLTIVATEDSLAKAEQMFLASNRDQVALGTENEPPVKESNQFQAAGPASQITFYTAGNKRPIEASSEELSKAAALLQKPVVDDKARKTTPPFQPAGPPLLANKSFERKKAQKIGTGPRFGHLCATKPVNKTHPQPARVSLLSASKQMTPRPAMSFFQSAGSGAPIQVLEENLAKAEKLLGNKAEEPNRACSFTTSASATNSFPDPKSSSQPCVAFQTAGTKRQLQISSEEMTKAEKLLQNASEEETATSSFARSGSVVPHVPLRPCVTVEKPRQRFPAHRRPTANNNDPARAIDRSSSLPPKVSLHRTQQSTYQPASVGASAPAGACLMFQSAGSGTNIQVTHEQLVKANTLLVGASEDTKGSKTNLPVFQSAGSGQSIDITEEQLSKANALFQTDTRPTEQVKPESARPTMPFFRSAGSGQSITITEEQLSEADALFQKDSRPTEQVKPASSAAKPTIPFFQMAGSGKDLSVSDDQFVAAEAMLSKEPKTHTATIAFQSAGSGKELSLSNEQLCAAKAMLSKDPKTSKAAFAFQSAGSGKELSVSDEQFFAAESMLQKNRETPRTTISFQRAGSGRQFQATEDELAKATDLLRRDPKTPKTIARVPRVSFSHTDGKCAPELSNEKRASLAARTPNYEVHKTESQKTVGTKGTNTAMQCTALRPQASHTPGTNLAGLRLNMDTRSFSKSLFASANQTGGSLVSSRKSGRVSFAPVPPSFQRDQEKLDDENQTKDESGHLLASAIIQGDMSDMAACKVYGVHESIIQANSMNAESIRFDRSTGFACGYVNGGITGNSNQIGSPADIRSCLAEKGCKTDRLTDRWITNHARWVNWKLCSIERRFARFLSNRFFGFSRLISHLHSRYRKEIEDGKRSAVRKILNRDISPKHTMILCIARVFCSKSKPKPPQTSTTTSYSLELTDGWWSVLAKPDEFLSSKIEDGVLCEGTKLAITQASLYGGDEGVDPLDKTYVVSPTSSAPFLGIVANGTRLAAWDSKLGFVATKHGSLQIHSMKDIVEGGGNVPQIDVHVLKKFALQYFVQDANAPRRVISEREETERRLKYEKETSLFVEKMQSEIEAECTSEVDEDAPDVWRQYSCVDGGDTSSLGAEDRFQLEAWQKKRTEILRTRIDQEMKCKMEDEGLEFTPSKPLQKYLVCTSDYFEDNRKELTADLSLWEPTEQQIETLKEGSCVTVRDISVREGRYDGRLQLSASNRTVVVPSSCVEGKKQTKNNASNRTNLFQIHLMTKTNPVPPPKLQNLVGIVVDSTKTAMGWNFLVTDRSGLALRVECFEEGNAINSESLNEPFPARIFQGLQLIEFDSSSNCAVAEMAAGSSIKEDASDPGVMKVCAWLKTDEGRGRLSVVAPYVKAFLKPYIDPSAAVIEAVGYIRDFCVANGGHILIKVDCGAPGLHCWSLPLSLIARIRYLKKQEHNVVVLSKEEEERYSNLSSLDCIPRLKSPLRFSLKPSGVLSKFHCHYEVLNVGFAKIDALTTIYHNLLTVT